MNLPRELVTNLYGLGYIREALIIIIIIITIIITILILIIFFIYFISDMNHLWIQPHPPLWCCGNNEVVAHFHRGMIVPTGRPYRVFSIVALPCLSLFLRIFEVYFLGVLLQFLTSL